MRSNPRKAARHNVALMIALLLIVVTALVTLWALYVPATDAYTFNYQYEQNIDGVIVSTSKESCVRFNPNKSDIEDVKRYFIQLHPVDSGVLSISKGCPKVSMTHPNLNELYL